MTRDIQLASLRPSHDICCVFERSVVTLDCMRKSEVCCGVVSPQAASNLPMEKEFDAAGPLKGDSSFTLLKIVKCT